MKNKSRISEKLNVNLIDNSRVQQWIMKNNQNLNFYIKEPQM